MKDIKVEKPLHRGNPTLSASQVWIQYHEELLCLESFSAALYGHVTLCALTQEI